MDGETLAGFWWRRRSGGIGRTALELRRQPGTLAGFLYSAWPGTLLRNDIFPGCWRPSAFPAVRSTRPAYAVTRFPVECASKMLSQNRFFCSDLSSESHQLLFNGATWRLTSSRPKTSLLDESPSEANAHGICRNRELRTPIDQSTDVQTSAEGQGIRED